MAVRCAALVIYSRVTTLTFPHCRREIFWSMPFSPTLFLAVQLTLTSVRHNMVRDRGNTGWLHIMVKTLKRPGLPLLPCCCSGLRSTSMEQKVWRLMGQDAHCLPKMSQVWIQLVTFFECHILDAFNLSGHCAVVFVSKAHMSLKCFHAGYTQYLSTTLKLQVWVFVRLIVKNSRENVVHLSTWSDGKLYQI